MRNIATFALIAGLSASMLASAEVDKKVAKTWKAKCASCHSADGSGSSEQGKKMGAKDYTKADVQAKFTDAQLKEAILNGSGKDMPAYKDLAEQADGLVAQIREFKK